MKTIHRYALELTDARQTKELPYGAEVLSAAIKPNESAISVWVLFEPYLGEPVNRTFRIISTGHTITDDLEGFKFIDTVIHQIGGSTLCWHVFVK